MLRTNKKYQTRFKEEKMKKLLFFSLIFLGIAVAAAVPGSAFAAATISAGDYKAGDTVTIEGTIAPGQDLFIAVAEQKMFAPKDTDGVHETKRLAKDGKNKEFNPDTAIPPLYYMLTTVPDRIAHERRMKDGAA